MAWMEEEATVEVDVVLSISLPFFLFCLDFSVLSPSVPKEPASFLRTQKPKIKRERERERGNKGMLQEHISILFASGSSRRRPLCIQQVSSWTVDPAWHGALHGGTRSVVVPLFLSFVASMLARNSKRIRDREAKAHSDNTGPE